MDKGRLPIFSHQLRMSWHLGFDFWKGKRLMAKYRALARSCHLSWRLAWRIRKKPRRREGANSNGRFLSTVHYELMYYIKRNSSQYLQHQLKLCNFRIPVSLYSLPLRHALFFHVCSFRRKDPWRSRRCPTGGISVTVEEPRAEELTAMSELLQAGGLYRWDGGCWYLRAKKDVNYNNSGLFWLAGCFFFQRFNFQVCCRHNVFFFCKTGLYLLRTLCVLLQEAEEQNANCILHGTRDAHFEHER